MREARMTNTFGRNNNETGKKNKFPLNFEADLVRHCLLMGQRFFFRNNKDLLKMPGVPFGAANNLPNSFNVKNKSAGEKRLKILLEFHPEILSVRLSQDISTACVKSFAKENVNTFLDLLEPELRK